MIDFVTDGTPFETPEAAADEGYAETPAGLGQALGEEAMSTATATQRESEMGAYQGSSLLAQMFYSQASYDAAVPGVDVPLPGSVPTPVLSHDEYQQRFAPNGPDGKPVSLGDGPMPEGVARLVGEAKRDELERDAVLDRFQNSHGWASNLGAGMAGFMLDPLRAATAFVPGLGEDAFLGAVGTGIAGRVAARLGAGAVTGAVAQAPLSALQLAMAPDQASDYGLRSAFGDMFYAAAGNAAMHAGFGTLGDLWHERATGAPSPAAQVVTGPAEVTHAAMSGAVSQIADGRPADVTPVFANTPEFLTARAAAQEAAGGLRRPPDIIDFLNARGGLTDEGGELAAMDLDQRQPAEPRPGENAAQFQQRRSMILSRDGGMNFDEGREIAEEDGYLEPGSTINDLLDAVRETAAGRPVFKPAEAEAWQAAQDAARQREQEAEFWNPNNIFAENQAQLYRDGYAPGIPEREFVADQPGEQPGTSGPAIDIDGERSQTGIPTAPPRPAEAAAEGEAPAPATPGAETENGARAPQEMAPAPVDPEIAEAERQAAASGAELTPEEHATGDAFDLAQRKAEAIDEAMGCLREAGL